jgi:N-glycosylase/DNA lyase
MSETHEKILEAIDAYLEENAKFEEKGVKAAATRARKSLMDLKNLAHERRKEIQEKKNNG